MKVVVLSDTHIVGSGMGRLPEGAWKLLRSADMILHAGDVVAAPFLDELRELAPVLVVLGNNDHSLVGALPEQLELELGGVRVAMIHDSGASRGREARMRRQFPSADVVVFGHSHIPWDAAGVDGQRLFNPGSATQRRAQPRRTIGELRIDSGRVSTRIISLD